MFQIMLIDSIVDYSLHITFIVAHFHVQFKNIFIHKSVFKVIRTIKILLYKRLHSSVQKN